MPINGFKNTIFIVVFIYSLFSSVFAEDVVVVVLRKYNVSFVAYANSVINIKIAYLFCKVY